MCLEMPVVLEPGLEEPASVALVRLRLLDQPDEAQAAGLHFHMALDVGSYVMPGAVIGGRPAVFGLLPCAL